MPMLWSAPIPETVSARDVKADIQRACGQPPRDCRIVTVVIPGRENADPARPYVGVFGEADDPRHEAYATQVATWWHDQHPHPDVPQDDPVRG